MFGTRLGIDRPAIVGRDQDVAVGMKDFAGEGGDPSVFFAAGPQRKVWSVLISVRSLQRNSGGFRGAGNKLDHAAQRFAAVEAGGAFLRDFDARNRFGGNAIPVHPAAERIVERNSILQHQRAAGAVGTQAAQ